MKSEQPEKVIKWLESKPSLSELGTQFPELHKIVLSEITLIFSGKSSIELPAYLKKMNIEESSLKKKFAISRGEKKIGDSLVKQIILNRMAHLAIKQHLISEATGIEKGSVRFNLLNGFIAQKLLFSDNGFTRKPVSFFWFKLLWPFVWQRKFLMPLVQPKGIYCFYSRKLIESVAALIGQRNCLEIAAGDGTLTRFLAESGVNITATDDYSWSSEVNYPASVIKSDAAEALREYAPEVVICSWPPAANSFEKQLFRNKNVQLYIVIGSRHHFAAGNWNEYQQQSAFDFKEDKKLSTLVLPPELDAAVYIFNRKQTVSN